MITKPSQKCSDRFVENVELLLSGGLTRKFSVLFRKLGAASKLPETDRNHSTVNLFTRSRSTPPPSLSGSNK